MWRKDSVVSNIAKRICFDAKTRCVNETVLVDVRLVHVDGMLMLPYREGGASCLVDAGWRGVWDK